MMDCSGMSTSLETDKRTVTARLVAIRDHGIAASRWGGGEVVVQLDMFPAKMLPLPSSLSRPESLGHITG